MRCRSLSVLATLVLLGPTACAAPDTARSSADAAPVSVAPSAPAASTTLPSASQAAIRALVKSVNPSAAVKSIHPSPLPGVSVVLVDAGVWYVSDDARYILYGALIDTHTQTNLTDDYNAQARVDILKAIPARDRITFSPDNPKYTVTVFTDTSCGYCQLLDKHMQSYLDAGIALSYVPFPRSGKRSPAFSEMQNVWCAADRKHAYMQTMGGTTPPEAKACPSGKDVGRIYALGQKLGITGTPTVFDESGRKIGGYLTAADMLSKLQHGPQ